MIPNWKEEFKNSSQEKKKMMLSSIIDLIVVNDDDIEIRLKMSLKDFIESSQNKVLKEEKTSLKNKTKNLENLNKRGTHFTNANLGALG